MTDSRIGHWMGFVAKAAVLVACASAMALGCGDGSTPAPGTEPPPSPVVDVGWLAQRLDDDGVQVVDARTVAAEFEQGHIPGALRVDPYEVAANVDGIEAQIAPASVAEPLLRARGLREGTTVVVYGKPPEFDPTRVAWALRYYGHADVRYLDGGWAAWEQSGEPIETGASTVPPSDYAVRTNAPLRVTGDWILGEIGGPPYENDDLQIVDARSPGEFAAGRIPGAVHIQWSTNLADGFLRPRTDVEALHAGLDPSKTTVVYCLAGWRAAFAWITLEWLGFEDVRVYDGSWFEWGEVEGFPIETDAGVS